jgi:hypothetical protein
MNFWDGCRRGLLLCYNDKKSFCETIYDYRQGWQIYSDKLLVPTSLSVVQ